MQRLFKILLSPLSFLKSINIRSVDALLDKFQLPLLIASIGFVFFIFGMAVIYFELPPFKKINSVFEGGQAWVESQAPENDPEKTSGNVEDAIEDAKVIFDKQRAFIGYTLIAARYTTTVYLVDMQGRIVHQWSKPWRQAFSGDHSHVTRPVMEKRIFFEGGQVLPNGDFIGVYTGDSDTPWGYGMVKLDKNSKTLWTYQEKSHHNIYVDIPGNKVYGTVHYFIKEPKRGFEDLNYPLMVDDVVILNLDTGEELDRIPLLDAFKDTPYEVYLYHHPAAPRAAWDFFHANSVVKLEPEMADKFPMFKAGQLLVSLRNADLIAVIDPETKKVVWATTGSWRNQHHAQFLDNGHILLMDNLGLTQNKTVYSQIIEYDPITAGVVWRFPTENSEYKFINSIYGHVQRLPNGNTLFGETFGLRLIEVTPDGKIVWSYKLAMPGRRINTKGLSFPEGILMYKGLGGASALVNHHRYAPSELPFLKTVKPKGKGNDGARTKGARPDIPDIEVEQQ
jgi:hypothetical protein